MNKIKELLIKRRANRLIKKVEDRRYRLLQVADAVKRHAGLISQEATK